MVPPWEGKLRQGGGDPLAERCLCASVSPRGCSRPCCATGHQALRSWGAGFGEGGREAPPAAASLGKTPLALRRGAGEGLGQCGHTGGHLGLWRGIWDILEIYRAVWGAGGEPGAV